MDSLLENVVNTSPVCDTRVDLPHLNSRVPHLEYIGAGLPINGREIQGVTPFEVLVGDPSYFYWVAVPYNTEKPSPINHRPFAGVDAGFELWHRHRATFISQLQHEGGLCPGKVHSTHPTGEIGQGGRECHQKTHDIRLLAWAN